MITSYELFLENLSDKIILYRGDSSPVEKHVWDKIDWFSVMGPGLYLTDNKEVAETYTIKTDKTTTSSKKIGDFKVHNSKNNLELIKTEFIKQILLSSVNDINPDEEIEILTPTTIKGLGYEAGFRKQKLSFKSLFHYDLHLNLDGSFKPQTFDKTEDKTYVKNQKKFDLEIYSKYHNSYQKAYQYFLKNQDHIKFMMVNKDDDNEKWIAVDTSIKSGSITTFELSKHTIDKCIDTTLPIKKLEFLFDVLENNFKKIYPLSDLSFKKENDFRKRITLLSNKNEAQYVIREIAQMIWLYNNTDDNNLIIKTFWEGTINDLKAIGFTGFYYQGGLFTGVTTKHKAYCIWDFEQAKIIEKENI